MEENRFSRILLDELSHTRENGNREKVLNTLREFCLGVQEATHDAIRCVLKQGFVVNAGQEWRAVIQSKDGNDLQMMFRAYVPLDGLPVQLDLHQTAWTQCNSTEELVAKLEGFLREPNVIEQIRYFANYVTAA